ncbi:uncharacterized protein LOC113372975 isoform X4 [Ctenocephalides felis]|uniref:uncharacterized protein LOC113372975 isoform X4 n=1 Tax=Ctenocephalides felis TaxID=7515 RepID=UPI000E6E1B2A|nr:uncharacterized protein LOC113372975 isoform X4 [Ctenocephalides felis]
MKTTIYHIKQMAYISHCDFINIDNSSNFNDYRKRTKKLNRFEFTFKFWSYNCQFKNARIFIPIALFGIFPETFYQVLSTTAALQTDFFTRNPSRNILPVLSTTAALHTDSLNQESFQKHFTRSSQSNYYCPVAPNIKSLEYPFMCMTRKCFFFSLTAYNYA